MEKGPGVRVVYLVLAFGCTCKHVGMMCTVCQGMCSDIVRNTILYGELLFEQV